MAHTVQTIGDPICLTFTALEEKTWWGYIERIEAGHSPTGRDEWLARVLASRGLPALPADYCWHLAGGVLTIKQVVG